ncbi:Predicted transcriptional regulators [Marinactinospora thermotolerans DSM 45154]|uniref:Predicted transcriptional regulators n=1 Tax=Marinactinospora thermotolerans DSM 45154 TaxID=1122192 RepID=A0A1T4PNB0_9ACTN|nr:DUF5937 family protein [Marinactinospora thermotolerans]SJZ92919.1 Predicted transcriptional regulators [Marinactinospora thermotolerans DSM 45154]
MAGRFLPGTEDLMRIRFAVSPLWETLAAVHTLGTPQRRSYHLPWARAVEAHAGSDLAPLRLLLPRPGFVPDFLTPVPEEPVADIADEIARVRATPPEQVDKELRACLLDPRRGLAARVSGPLLADPAATRDRLADLLAACWQRLVRPWWGRVRSLLEDDIVVRSRALAEGGLDRLFADLHPDVRREGEALLVEGPEHTERILAGEGLVLMPSAFLWPELTPIMAPPWQPALAYPARGVGRLWGEEADPPPGTLARLIGRSRARLLTALDEPATTTALAHAHGLSPAAVSGHLTALRDAGLLETRRVGRRVFYARTPLGQALLNGGSAGGDTGVRP